MGENGRRRDENKKKGRERERERRKVWQNCNMSEKKIITVREERREEEAKRGKKRYSRVEGEYN